MGYLGNLASDVRSSVFSSRRMYKSLSDTPSYRAKGYSFAYNLGTASALSGFSFGRGRGAIYDSLQFYNSAKAAVNPQQKKINSIARRATYKLAAFGYGRVMNAFLPVAGGLGGRAMRVMAGRFTSTRLRRLDAKVRAFLYADFSIDAKKVDKYVQDTTSKVGFDLIKIQRGMQAIAISNAPDPYAIHRFNRNDSRGSIARLGKEDKIMSAFSLSTFDDENIEALLSRKDIVEIMGTDALAGSPNSLGNISTHGFGPHKNGRILESLYAPSTGNRGEFDRDRTPSMTRTEANNLADYAVGESGIGAEYAFGNPTGGAEVVTKIKEFIAESMLVMDKMGPNFIGPVQNHITVAAATARSLQEKLDKLGPEGILQLGKSVDVMRYLHGDDANYTGRSSYRKKSRFVNASLNVYAPDVDEEYNHPITRNVTVAEGEYNSTSFVMPNLKEERVTHQDRFGLDVTEQVPVQGPQTSVRTLTGRTVTEKRIEYQKRTRRVRGENLGSLDYRKKIEKNQRPPETPINRDGYLTQSFSDNPSRHNFVPNKRQIQSAIHALEPNYKDKNATVTYSVAFGGKNAKSTRPDAIRDAYQIEYGGPGTDKRGKLTERTDMFVYTPSLFMYRSALGAAKAFGLQASSGRNIVGHVSGGMQGVSGSNQLSDIFVKSRGVTGPTGSKERKIMEELYEKAAKNIDNPIFENGHLMLSKNKVLSTAFDTGALDLASETLNDSMFGGKRILKEMGVANKDGVRPMSRDRSIYDRRGFEKVIKDEDSILNQEKAIHRMQKELGRTGQVMPSDEFLDENIVGAVLDSPPPSGFYYRTFTDDNGVTKYEITSRQFDEALLPLNDEGRPFIPGNVINSRSKKNITSVDTGFDYEEPGVIEDVHMLKELEALGISGPDQTISDDVFEKYALKHRIGRQLQFQNLRSNIERQFRNRLSILSDEIDNSAIQDFANRLTNNLMDNIRRKGTKFKYAGGGDSGIDSLTPREVNLITEFFGAQFEALNSLLRKTSFRGRGQRRTVSRFHTEEISGDTRDQIIRDSNLSARQMGIFFDESYRDELVDIFSFTNHIEAALDGSMDINTAINLTRRRSELALGKLESRIENPITDSVTDVSGKKKARVDIPGTTITPGGRSGNAPVGSVNTTGNAHTNSFMELVAREERDFGLRSGSTAAQLKYVQSEIKRLENSTNREKVKVEITAKCQASPLIQNAFIRFIAQDVRSRGMGLDNTTNGIREYLDTFYSNIGLAPPDF